MKKFTKIKPKEEIKLTDKEDVVFSNGTFNIKKYEDWDIIEEKDLVICIPYLIDTNQIIIRSEYVPTYKYVDGQEYHITVISGGIEIGEYPEDALVRELEEEAGIVLRDNFKIDFSKPLFINKGTANKYYPCILRLTKGDFEEVVATTDGSMAEKKSKSIKIDIKYIKSLNASDLITEYMLLLVKDYLNMK